MSLPNPTVPTASVQTVCPHCGHQTVAAVVARTINEAPLVAWLRCPGCNQGFVDNGSIISPSPLPGVPIEGLPAEVEAAYQEARRTAGVNAYTSCELMCRKILMHIAVDKGADEGKSFVEYLNYIETTGYATPPMRPWLDLIRQHGNVSTHRLAAATEERAMNTLTFTAQLLRLVYEMDHKAQQFMPRPSTTP